MLYLIEDIFVEIQAEFDEQTQIEEMIFNEIQAYTAKDVYFNVLQSETIEVA